MAKELFSLAEKIKYLRENAELTQSALAKSLGLSRSGVNAWEMGISIPSTQYVVELAKLFNVSTDYLLGLSVTKDDITTLSEQKYGSRSLKELLNDIASLDSENIVLLNAYIDFLISRQKK